MNTFLIVLHVMACLVLVLVVLLQRGKGSDIGAALGGGGSNTVFGSRGAGNFLTKLTTGSSVIFMLTSLTLAYMGNQSSNPLDLGDAVIDLERAATANGGDPDAPSASALEEVEDARRYLLGSYVFGFETNAGTAAQLVQLERHGLGCDYPDRFVERVEAVTAEDIHGAVARHLHPDRLICVSVGRA